MNRMLTNIQKGYAEVLYGEPDDMNAPWGYICRKTFVVHTDFENDEIYEVERWKAYVYMRDNDGLDITVGRITGYKTYKEALDVLDRYVEEHYDQN